MQRVTHWFWLAISGITACSGGTNADANDTQSSVTAPALGAGDAEATRSGADRAAGDGSGGELQSSAAGDGSGGELQSSAGDADAGGDGAGGAAGSAQGQAGSSSGGGSAGAASSSCPARDGTAVPATAYDPPDSARACQLQPAYGTEPGASVTVTSEAEFLARFNCPEGAASGIDFASQRLHVTVIPEFGFGPPPPVAYAVLDAGAVHLGFVLSPYCGGAFPPSLTLLTLLPSGELAVLDEPCTNGGCGAGGFPP